LTIVVGAQFGIELDQHLDHSGMLAGQIGLRGEPIGKGFGDRRWITSVKSSSDKNALSTKRDGHHIS
jgi:hypothetical protein